MGLFFDARLQIRGSPCFLELREKSLGGPRELALLSACSLGLSAPRSVLVVCFSALVFFCRACPFFWAGGGSNHPPQAQKVALITFYLLAPFERHA
jgi:hypothetical protein